MRMTPSMMRLAPCSTTLQTLQFRLEMIPSSQLNSSNSSLRCLNKRSKSALFSGDSDFNYGRPLSLSYYDKILQKREVCYLGSGGVVQLSPSFCAELLCRCVKLGFFVGCPAKSAISKSKVVANLNISPAFLEALGTFSNARYTR